MMGAIFLMVWLNKMDIVVGIMYTCYSRVSEHLIYWRISVSSVMENIIQSCQWHMAPVCDTFQRAQGTGSFLFTSRTQNKVTTKRVAGGPQTLS
jgi:hypothetical protein